MTLSDWSHEKVHQALVDRGEPLGGGVKEPYVMLYPQEPNCALLYAPTTQRYRSRPLHLKHDRSSWRADVFSRIQPALDEGRLESQGWMQYRVLDWNLLAARLGLAGLPSDGGIGSNVTTVLGDSHVRPTETGLGGPQGTPPAVATPTEKPHIPLIPEEEESRHPEGAALYRLHRQLERDTTLAKKAKQKRLAETGCLWCDVCGFDFEREYGVLGAGFIEAHHTIPVSELTGETKTQLADLALVCSNCHRMLHRGPQLLTIDELRALRQDNE